ncbi:hypothetical protein OKE80_07090 [Riemerella anatipestifer]|uniref:hypothetical protein n=1 Tax=Riemerella anatipestifer TaxID=34085 RepID=UPI00210B09A1|nr:hypothetical protein [Riemerella anatipestifer]MCQ4155343.1 hypothetical protein [Riemerella anatipestifer]MCQ4181343.1 hypothetical protein [Riemerella anatipestifer]MCW0474588.1 hypothetical protein [Riemerella anatipestifer]MCW0519483.1 hypothetical protein [Riemerella anatipestifer]MDY3397447.1 hypothetical protein [Riemerella anatipestifer]
MLQNYGTIAENPLVRKTYLSTYIASPCTVQVGIYRGARLHRAGRGKVIRIL